jgi:hypothetical protein
LASERFLVFDVESVGLHGEGFAVGYVILLNGQEMDSGCWSCPRVTAHGDMEGWKWVEAHVPDLLVTHPNTHALRSSFWHLWQEWQKTGALLVADCAWPVEARFLLACVDDDPETRTWQGPYPLHDLASIRLAAGLDPLASELRREDELPLHNPLADARQSARLLVEALEGLRKKE